MLANVFLDWVKYRAKYKMASVRTTAGVKAGSAFRKGVNNGISRAAGGAKKGAAGAAKGAAKGKKAGAAKGDAAVKAPKKAKQEKKVGLFGKKKKDDGGEEFLCPNGHEMDPSWNACPYCGEDERAGRKGGGGPAEKTVAVRIDIEEPLEVDGWVVALNGNHRGQDFRLHSGKNTIGTAADCDIVITDPYLSSGHAVIRHDASDGSFTVIDHDSTNGTFVNDKRISKDELIDNDTIRLGRTEMKFKALF